MIKVLNVYECPKCRQLRTEDTFSKGGVYFSTCKPCRANKGVEENFLNIGVNKLAAIKGSEYKSLNTSNFELLGKSDRKRAERKSAIINAHIFKLVKDYTTLPSTIDNNYRFINMLKRLTSMDVADLGVGDIREELKVKFKYNTPKHKLTSATYDIQLVSNGRDIYLGQGHVVVALEPFDLLTEGVLTKKETRKLFCDNKKALLKTLSENKELRCYICKKELKEKDVTIDHKIPIVSGGTNDIENLEICCDDCNQSKAAYSEDEFSEFKYKLDAVGKLESKLLIETENLKDSISYARSQIAYYEGLEKSLAVKVDKNKNKIATCSEYRNSLKTASELESRLSIQ